MASLYSKKINGGTYYYLREMAWVDGAPKIVSEKYLGTAVEVAAAVEARNAAMLPERTSHLAFGDVVAVWDVLRRLDVAGIVDEVVGRDAPGAKVSTGIYLALAALCRVVAPRSKAAFADWWKTTAGERFAKIPATALDHRRFWDAMHLVTLEEIELIEHRIALRAIELFDLDVSSLALDMTNFATYIDSTNAKAPIAQRGKAKQKRADLRLVGLGLVVTRDGGIPLVAHAYPGNKPDVTQFPTMLDTLVQRYGALLPDGADPQVTVVFDAGQNSVANFTHLTGSRLRFVGSVPPSDCPDLLGLPARVRKVVDGKLLPGVSAYETRRGVYERDYRIVLTHSKTLHEAQARGFEQTLAKAGAKLDALAEKLARGKTRRRRDRVEHDIQAICHDTWATRVITWNLAGDTPAAYRLTWAIDRKAKTALAKEVFGKRVLATDQDDWTTAEVITAYRSQSEAEFAFRQMKDPHTVSFGPIHHWTDHNIRIHVFTCVLALQAAHLMRREAKTAGHDLSVRALLASLAAIQETVLIYPSTGGRPKTCRMLTDQDTTQQALAALYGLERWAPRTFQNWTKRTLRWR